MSKDFTFNIHSFIDVFINLPGNLPYLIHKFTMNELGDAGMGKGGRTVELRNST